MNGWYWKGMAAGGILGIAVGMMLLPRVGMDVQHTLMNGGRRMMKTVKSKIPAAEKMMNM